MTKPYTGLAEVMWYLEEEKVILISKDRIILPTTSMTTIFWSINDKKRKEEKKKNVKGGSIKLGYKSIRWTRDLRKTMAFCNTEVLTSIRKSGTPKIFNKITAYNWLKTRLDTYAKVVIRRYNLGGGVIYNRIYIYGVILSNSIRQFPSILEFPEYTQNTQLKYTLVSWKTIIMTI